MKNMEALAARLKSIDSKVGKVGWLDGRTYEDGGPSVAAVAATQEYGFPPGNIPPRPFFGPTIAQHRDEWMSFAERGVRQVLKGKLDMSQLLDLLGQTAAGQVRETIASIWSPPLAPMTKAHRRAKYAKGGKESANLYKPLIDTGIMYQSLTSSVEDE